MKINYNIKKGLLIIGASGHGKVVADVALEVSIFAVLNDLFDRFNKYLY